MKKPLPIKAERLEKRFLKAVSKSRPLAVEKEGFMGTFRGKRFTLYRKKRGLFALCPCVLQGRIKKEEGVLSLSFRRPLWWAIPLSLWSLLSLAAGLSLLFSQPTAALFFLLPPLPLALSLFLFSKKERDALLFFLDSLLKE